MILCFLLAQGYRALNHTSFFDLFRLENNQIVEHRDTTETQVLRYEWRNINGKL